MQRHAEQQLELQDKEKYSQQLQQQLNDQRLKTEQSQQQFANCQMELRMAQHQLRTQELLLNELRQLTQQLGIAIKDKQ